jgi:formate dehydrogenase major subunit
MLVKRSSTTAGRSRLSGAFIAAAVATVDRRTFLKRSGLAAGGLAAVSGLSMTMVGKAEAGPTTPGVEIIRKKSICTHCSVGCTVTAEVQNGVWVGQEPSWDSPINNGTHCAKGAAVRELVHGDRRLKYPMKLENGQWKRLSWDQKARSSNLFGHAILSST